MKLKCLIDYKIDNPEEKISRNDIKAIYNDNEITFKDDKDSIKIKINNDNITIIKDNFSSKTTLNFIKGKKTDSEYIIKPLNMTMDLKILTSELIIEDNKIYIEYETWFDTEYSGKFKYDLEIKEM